MSHQAYFASPLPPSSIPPTLIPSSQLIMLKSQRPHPDTMFSCQKLQDTNKTLTLSG